jgi:hypothetical protein
MIPTIKSNHITLYYSNVISVNFIAGLQKIGVSSAIENFTKEIFDEREKEQTRKLVLHYKRTLVE